MKSLQVVVLLMVLGFLTEAQARGFSGNSYEDQKMVGNGQGISSPNFWEGLKSQNPAGLSYNQRLKFQAAGATFDDSTSNLRGSGGVLFGADALSGGVEYAQFSSSAYAKGTGAVNWGLAGRLDALALRVGVSGHHLSGSSGDYDFGLILEPIHSVLLGVLLPSIQNGFHDIGAGLTFELDPAFDLVLDASMNPKTKDGVVKPGITLHADRFQVSGAYGVRYHGTSDPLLYEKLSVALGIKITDHVLLEYSYRGLPQHLVGLTLR